MKIKVFARLAAGMILIAGLGSLIYHVEASFTSPLTVNFSYPLFPTPTDPSRVGGSGVQQIFRTGSVPAAGVFASLDPKNGNAPAGATLNFFVGNAAAIGATDFVYALKITNSANATLPLTALQAGSCAGSKFTSIGYVKYNSGSAINPTDGNFIAALGQLFFTFDAQTIPPGGESTILFFTSPDPPSLVTSFIGGGSGADSVSSNIDPTLKLYSPCPVSLTTDKKIGCSAATVADNPLTAIVGSPIVYQVAVKNNGKAPLANIVITDPQFGGNINSSFTVNSSPFAGTLAANQTAIANLNATATVNVTNTASVAGEYLILNQQGTPSGQTFLLSESATAVLSDSTMLTVLAKPSIQSSMTVTPTSFTALPQVLTYTLKATNNGTADISTVIDVDAKLKDIVANGKPGLTVSSPTNFPTIAQNLIAGAMKQVVVNITVNTVAGWQALADAGLTQSTFSMTATGTLNNVPAGSCGAASISSSSSAITSFTPPCSMEITKTIACDAGGGVPADAAFSASALVYPTSKVYYRYKVTNTSLVDAISNITITDTTTGVALPAVGTLAAGAMKIIDVPVTITQPVGPIIDAVSVNGSCSMGVVTASTTSNVKVVAPKITAQQLVNGGTLPIDYQIGQALTFTLIATNDSTSGTPVDLTIDDVVLKTAPNVVIKNGSTTISLPYTVPNVLPGQSVTLTATVTFATLADFKIFADSQYNLTNVLEVRATLPGNVKACSLGVTMPPPPLTLSVNSPPISVPPPPPPTSEICIIQTCEPNCPAPLVGQSLLAKGNTSDDKPGSILLYNIYSSDSTNTKLENTALTLTNLGPKTIFTHMFMIDGASCSIQDFFACLSPNQTSFWSASELDPGVTGYMIAVAVNEEGIPVSFNYLIGSSKVKFKSGHTSNLNAQAFSALYPFNTTLPGFAPNSSTAELKLDGVQYNQAPMVLSVDNFVSPLENNSTLLILNPVGGDLSSLEKMSTVGTLSGQVYNDREKVFSFISSNNQCQVRRVLGDSFPRLVSGLTKIISNGTTGTMRFQDPAGTALTGAVINFNPDVLTKSTAFSHGHNLHFLSFTDTAKYTIPVFRPHS